MNIAQKYFSSKKMKHAEHRMASVLSNELNRLDKIAQESRRKQAFTIDNLRKDLKSIFLFCEEYHKAFNLYVESALKQHENKIKCTSHCGNCCRHYPMSIAPFELLYFYNTIRNTELLLNFIQKCFARVEKYHFLLRNTELKNSESLEELEEVTLHSFFASKQVCPFLSEEESCSFYKERPVSCRMYFSETESKYCVSEFLQTTLNRSFIIYLPDHIEESIELISKHYESLGFSESFFEGILQVNALEGALFYGLP